MQQTATINRLTPEIRNVMTASLKWIRRIEDRAASLPPSFMDNTDIKPLRKEIENILKGQMTDASCAILRQAFIDSGAAE